jgi:hypothetical protein
VARSGSTPRLGTLISVVTFDHLRQWINQLGAGKRLNAAAKKQIAAELPEFIRDLDSGSAPSRLRLGPTGESLTNATRMTALKCQCLLLARSAFGVNYFKAGEEYECLAKDVLFWVMRYAFNSADPKGIFCCPACTLSLLPPLRGLVFQVGGLRRIEIHCPEGAERPHVGLRPRLSKAIRRMGSDPVFAKEALHGSALASRKHRGDQFPKAIIGPKRVETGIHPDPDQPV